MVDHRAEISTVLLRRRVEPVFLSALLAAAVVAVVFIPGLAWARKNGIEQLGCQGCHSAGNPPTVTLQADPPVPALGEPTTLSITISATNGNVAGFFLTTDGVNKGTFKTIESGTLANSTGVTHTTPRTGSGGSTVFKVQWSANVASGVAFVVYALSANGDGSSRGDGGGEAALSIATGCTPSAYYIDQDRDGYGSTDPSYAPRMDCAPPPGYAAQSNDCYDFNPKVYPGAPELCDGKDNNCDGKADETVVSAMYCEDLDGDGFGVTGGATKIDCGPSPGYGECSGDCNDRNATVYPGAPEMCDGLDNNCDRKVDENARMTCGLGSCKRTAPNCTSQCVPGPPGIETCNYFDDDCDGEVDNGDGAVLCGRPGLVCVLGQCVNEDGSPAASSGGSAGTIGSGGSVGSVGGNPSGGGTSSRGGGCAVAASPSGFASSQGRGGRAAIAIWTVLTAIATTAWFRRRASRVALNPGARCISGGHWRRTRGTPPAPLRATGRR